MEDNPGDEALTLRALKKNNIRNDVVVARDGAETLDYLFGTEHTQARSKDLAGCYVARSKTPQSGRTRSAQKAGHRRTHRTSRCRDIDVVEEDQDLLTGYKLGANSYIRKPVDFLQFNEALRNLGLYWLLLNESPPKES